MARLERGMTMGMFDGLENAQVFEKGKNLPEDGAFLVRIVRIEAPPNLRKGPAYIAGFTVEEATPVDSAILGTEYRWYQGFQSQPEAAQGAVLEFLTALAGFTMKEPGADVIRGQASALAKASCGAANPFAGMVVHVNTFVRPIKGGPNAGKPFTVHQWRPAVALCQGQAERMLAALSGSAYAPPTQHVVPPPAPYVAPAPQAPPALPPGWRYATGPNGQLIPVQG